MLKHKLKRSGLRQSPWSTPRPTDIKGVRNSFVRIEVLKSVIIIIIIIIIIIVIIIIIIIKHHY